MRRTPKTSRSARVRAPSDRRSASQASRSASERSDQQDSGDEEYRVGYARPPKHSRFKPGRSGNPKGRIKQSRNLRTVMQKVFAEDMRIREGDRIRRMPKIEALVRTTLARAFKGDTKAYAALGLLMRLAGYGEDAEPAADVLAGVDPHQIIEEFVARGSSGSSEKQAAPATPLSAPPNEGVK